MNVINLDAQTVSVHAPAEDPAGDDPRRALEHPHRRRPPRQAGRVPHHPRELDQNIITASSGEEALRWLLDNEAAVILLDVNMPGMDGLETAELIRSRRKSAHTPIIFITAFADEMHTARGYSLGAVDYILSPVVPNILRSKVKALVQLHRLNAELKKRSDERVALVKEQAARSVAEESQRRASFLAEAAQVMASSLDVDTILKGSSGLTVPFLADYAQIALLGESGASRARRPASVAGWDGYLGASQDAFEAAQGHAARWSPPGGGMHALASFEPARRRQGRSPGEIHGVSARHARPHRRAR